MREELLVILPNTQLTPAHVMKLNLLSVYLVVQHPAFVIISARPQLLLLINDHLPAPHFETSVSCHVLAAFQRCLETLPSCLVFLLRHHLCAKLLFTVLELLNGIALRAEHDHSAVFTSELEEP